MKHTFQLLIICLLASFSGFAQQPVPLDEVLLYGDKNLKKYSSTQPVVRLTDSVIKRSGSSLTDLLNTNSSIYFKENGAGMVSSPSFRGTTAQQTAVIWNGININSQLNGQTDFNTINPLVFDAVSVRSGGGSVLYGSSAIGGTVHLDNSLAFNLDFNTEFRVNYGSFDAYGVNFQTKYSTENVSTAITVNRTGSDNDFEFPDSNGQNFNGQFYNNSLNASVAFKLDTENTVRLYHYIFDGRRNFSLIIPTEIRTKYENTDTRSLVEWEQKHKRFTSLAKVAFLTEDYKYFANIYKQSYSGGSVNTLIGKLDLGYDLGSQAQVNAILSYNSNKGEGSSIPEERRNIAAASLLFKQKLGSLFVYELSGRKEATSVYDSPFLYSAGARYEFSEFYALSFNTSKNFRIPTYNDLYWENSGNADLKPETSYQAEVGNSFQISDFSARITGYYMDITNMIRWIPAGANWKPVNTDNVHAYGVEIQADYVKKFGHKQLKFSGNYAYTVSEDVETGDQLIYVPYNKTTFSAAYENRGYAFFYQLVGVGEVFTRSDNASQYNLEGYALSNLGGSYTFGRKKEYQVGLQVRNIFNTAYQSVASREMPGRNYNFYLNFNF
ncbi:TonB-dependent receptor plug domain-containing protein [Flavimarina sp. Hel_I_48]|uniref:TonB-dependent receptor plug domain-containing protein n=1 Tax=Flavimarina sp. Hel_I_48 TaxID=1392488 RepID=UPI0004DF7C10|nr:TonB-dependent receptor [Flavimarina sp. Hel_I_48]